MLVLKLPELIEIVDNNPFLKTSNIQENKLHITFFAEMPDSGKLKSIGAMKLMPDEFSVVNNAVYLHCPDV